MIRLLRTCLPVRMVGLFTSESVLFSACFVLAVYIWVQEDAHEYLADGGFARIAILAAAFPLIAYLFDAYTDMKVRSTMLLMSHVLVLIGAVLFIEAAVVYADPYWALPRPVSVIGSITALVTIFAWRLIYSRAVTRGGDTILFLGAAPMVFRLARQFRERPEIGMKPVGYLADASVESDLLPHVGGLGEISAVVKRLRPDRVVIACSDRRGQLPMHELLELRFAGFLFAEAASVYEEAFGRVPIDEIRPSHLILSDNLGPRRFTVRLQTIYSRVVALIGLIVTAPVILIASLLIKVTSPGPVFYRQRRVGLNGKLFHVYKLRSMRQDAEAKTGAVWATRNDPRVTWVGRILRKSRIDELPQFWNVLKGEMAIVGPRPERPEFVEQLTAVIPFYPQRHAVKPGITGWAQISYQYGDSLEHAKTKLEYDLYYIKNLSPALDLYVMLHTIKIMILSRGAQ
jgi:sugar transferase (PEP-CTERM system associated)